MSQALFILLGVFTGIASGMFGIGGGIIIIPLLVYGFKYEHLNAVPTSLVAMLLPVGSLSVYKYYKSGLLNPDHIKAGLLIGLGIFFGALLGAKIAIGLPKGMLTKIFSVFLFLVSLKLWFQK
jgi:uncharacterized membrane protein YfcA